MNDYVVIGAGMAGASVAFELAAHGSTILIEAESQPGYHSTGRSAALYTPNFGSPVVRAINRASATFFTDPPAGFDASPLLTPRGGLTVAAPGQEDALAAILRDTMDQAGPRHGISEISIEDALARAPILRPDRVGAAYYEEGISDIDVAALHQAYLRGFKARGGQLLCDTRVERVERDASGWTIVSNNPSQRVRVVVNAAGAWAGTIGEMAGATNIGLTALRRTAIILDAPDGVDVDAMPAVDYCCTDAYWKPDAGRILASPGDETPVEPQDAQPDELDVAILVDWVQTETTLKVRRIASSWAGLRSFVPDRNPVVGFDPNTPGFFWLAGQGGYGIMMAPTLARTAASLITTGIWPSELSDVGVDRSILQAAR